MKKLAMTAIAVGLAVGAVGLIVGCVAKKTKKKSQNDNTDIVDVDEVNVEDIEEIDENESVEDIEEDIIDEEEIVEVADDVAKSVEEDMSEETVVEIDPKNDRFEIIKYLAKNNVSQDLIVLIGKTLLDIQEDLPEEYFAVRKQMYEVIESPFEAETAIKFFNCIYDVLYTNMSPICVYEKYSNRISTMGDENRNSIIELMETIDTEIKNGNSDAVIDFAEIYNFIKYAPEKDFTEEVYGSKFKPYIEKFVTQTSGMVKEGE